MNMWKWVCLKWLFFALFLSFSPINLGDAIHDRLDTANALKSRSISINAFSISRSLTGAHVHDHSHELITNAVATLPSAAIQLNPLSFHIMPNQISMLSFHFRTLPDGWQNDDRLLFRIKWQWTTTTMLIIRILSYDLHFLVFCLSARCVCVCVVFSPSFLDCILHFG